MEEVTMKMSWSDAVFVYCKLKQLKKDRKAIVARRRIEGYAQDWMYKDIADLERVIEIIEKAINGK